MNRTKTALSVLSTLAFLLTGGSLSAEAQAGLPGTNAYVAPSFTPTLHASAEANLEPGPDLFTAGARGTLEARTEDFRMSNFRPSPENHLAGLNYFDDDCEEDDEEDDDDGGCWTQILTDATASPEPVTMILLGSGLVGLGGARFANRRSRATGTGV